jgi:hypothetical protein
MVAIYPEDADATAMKKENKNTYKILIKRTGRWAAAVAMLPMAYIWLPVSCCFVSPAIKYALPEAAEQMEHDKPHVKCIMNTLAGGTAGAAAAISCCCCFGNCCASDPEDVL